MKNRKVTFTPRNAKTWWDSGTSKTFCRPLHYECLLLFFDAYRQHFQYQNTRIQFQREDFCPQLIAGHMSVQSRPRCCTLKLKYGSSYWRMKHYTCISHLLLCLLVVWYLLKNDTKEENGENSLWSWFLSIHWGGLPWNWLFYHEIPVFWKKWLHFE